MSIQQFLAMLVALTVLANIVSYTIARITWRGNEENGAELEVKREAGESGTMVYLVAGCGNQPEQAFDFLMSDLDDYGVTFVNYRPNRGCDMNLIANQVLDDIDQHNYTKILVIGCSIGDYVGRVCEAEMPGRTYTIAINPEPDSSLLRPWAKVATRVGVPLGYVTTAILGWGSQWQGYGDCGNHFSWNFMVNQFREIGYCHDAPQVSTRVLGIIIAEADANGKGVDEFLQEREAMKAYFGNVDIYSAIGVGHANTVKGAEAYKVAWDQLWAKAKPIFDAS